MAWGTLFVVATPLGHLGDLTRRAAEVLGGVPVVAAEDTRRTRKLLSHLGARPRVLSLHAHSPAPRLEGVLRILREGKDVALVTDAGTPGVSDPGADLVRAVREAGGRVVPVPGPSAVAAALSAAGLPADRYLFLGFVPRRGPERRRILERAAMSEDTVVLFESPERLVTLLEGLAEVAGPTRLALVAREMTKVHEEFRAGTLSDQISSWSLGQTRGEVTVVLEGRPEESHQPVATDEAAAMARRLIDEGCSRRDVVRALVEDLAVPRNVAYRLVTELA
ncbi:MAG TPA: 16S rRNA (cytidine(1402)-2'-O)-methyltransferase [Gemmatimonadales bacterium]